MVGLIQKIDSIPHTPFTLSHLIILYEYHVLYCVSQFLFKITLQKLDK